MAADGWSVIVFGDSWAAYSHPTWPEALGRRLGARVFNFAVPGGVSATLHQQASTSLMSPHVPKTGGMLNKNTLIVVHTGGNDFIQKMMPVVMGGFMGGGAGNMANMEILQPNPGTREAATLKQFMETMYRAGGRHFLISGVPAHTKIPIFNMVWPVAAGLVNSGALEGLGISPGDPPQLAIEVQASALNERFESVCVDFQRESAGSICAYFNEVDAIDRVLSKIGEQAFNTQMWDFSMFHPTMWGHEQLATEAQVIVQEAFPALRPGGATPFSPPARSPTAAAPVPAPVPALVPAPAEEKKQESAEPEKKAGEAREEKLVDATPVEEKLRESAPVPLPVAEAGSITVRCRNVKGDAQFSVECYEGSGTSVADFRSLVVAYAPESLTTNPDAACTLVFQGKILKDDAGSLQDCGIGEASQVIVVMK